MVNPDCYPKFVLKNGSLMQKIIREKQPTSSIFEQQSVYFEKNMGQNDVLVEKLMSNRGRNKKELQLKLGNYKTLDRKLKH